MLFASQVQIIITEKEEWFKEIRQLRPIVTTHTSSSFKLDYFQSCATRLRHIHFDNSTACHIDNFSVVIFVFSWQPVTTAACVIRNA
jgi:hypothetical protein